MEITLNPEKASFWILRSGGGTFKLDEDQDGISLSFVAPGPIEVDFNSLTDEEQYKLVMALSRGEILSPQKSTLLTQLPLPKNKQLTKTISHEFQLLPEHKPVISPGEDLFERAKSILAASTATIKRQVSQVDNTTLLRTLLSVEEATKNRSTVVKLLKDKLARIELAFEQKRKEVEAMPVLDPAAGGKYGVGFTGVKLDFEPGEEVEFHLQGPEGSLTTG